MEKAVPSRHSLLMVYIDKAPRIMYYYIGTSVPSKAAIFGRRLALSFSEGSILIFPPERRECYGYI